MSLADKLTQERRGRLAAERMLELKQAELFAANRKLGQHAQRLTNEIVETRAQVETIRDENQRVKSDLTAAREKIELTERRLWQSIETIKDGFAFFNANNEMIMANRAYLAIFDGLDIICPGVNYVTILQVLTDEGIVNTGNLNPKSWRRLMTERLQDAAPEPTVINLWNGQHIKLIDQRSPSGDMVSLGLDITATVEYERQLQEAHSIAESANRAKSAFLANMSHEIRTPMNGVVGMADVLRDTLLTEDQRLYVDTIKNSGEALLVIINDVLDYSKIEAKKLDLHPEPFDLERAIQEVIMLLQPLAREKSLEMALDYDLFMPTSLVGDPGRIRQVLTNLLGNAVKFTSDGHVLVRVTGVPDKATGNVQVNIAIEDTGIGIAPDMVGHIFGEFNQVENERNRKFDGTGLGLAISQRLIQMMDGDIWVTSEEQVGSCFGFQLPLEAHGEITTPHPPLPRNLRHIMVVEGETVNRSIVLKQLEQLGLKVTCCDTAQDALAQIDDSVDLVLTDHIMPEMDGFDLASALRAAHNEVAIIIVSSNTSLADNDPARALVSAILKKPIPRSDLFSQLSDIKIIASKKSSAPLRKMRILAAEDNKTNQLVFSKMIQHLDVDLRIANNGEEAVDLYQSFIPDMIFMDISMPKMDGKEASMAIRQIEETKGLRCPIVALTAHAMSGDDKSILAAGLDHYLTKPLRKTDIVSQIEQNQPDGTRPLEPDAPQQATG
ncbi:response regulator [Sulfitobacter sp.]|uniref:response regulator n=1 Tax=Sulfitobacter sp. TaxID=1903071 RepID=UPI003565FEB4